MPPSWRWAWAESNLLRHWPRHPLGAIAAKGTHPRAGGEAANYDSIASGAAMIDIAAAHRHAISGPGEPQRKTKATRSTWENTSEVAVTYAAAGSFRDSPGAWLFSHRYVAIGVGYIGAHYSLVGDRNSRKNRNYCIESVRAFRNDICMGRVDAHSLS